MNTGKNVIGPIQNPVVIAMSLGQIMQKLSGGVFSERLRIYRLTHNDHEYTEVWPRVLHYAAPAKYDEYGLDENGQRWPYDDHALCIMDDFGNAVPDIGFAYTHEELKQYLAPDYSNPPAPGEPYKYILYSPMPH